MGNPPLGPRMRVRPQAAAAGRTDWYRIRNLAGSGAAEIYLYDEIGGWWGVTASDFVRELTALDAEKIDLHINSPGGSVWDGLAIYQALRNHKARITTYVDGLAASAASFIAMAGDRRMVAPHAELMIHDPWALAVGDAATMAEAAKDLDRVAENLASLYASRAGGGVEVWREAMRAETWYSATEAVAAGLAHEVQPDAEKGADDGGAAQAAYDLSMFAYAGRQAAPAPRMPAGPYDCGSPMPTGLTPARNDSGQAQPVFTAAQWQQLAAAAASDPPAAEPDNNNPTEEDSVSTDLSEVRSRLGLPDDADPAAIAAAIDALKAKTVVEPDEQPDSDDVAVPDGDSGAERPADPTAPVQPDPATQRAMAEMKAELVKLSQEVAATKAEKAAATKASVIDGALAAGKIGPGDKDDWARRYDEAPAVITDILDAMAPGTAVPVNPAGVAGPAQPQAFDEEAMWADIDSRMAGSNQSNQSKEG